MTLTSLGAAFRRHRPQLLSLSLMSGVGWMFLTGIAGWWGLQAAIPILGLFFAVGIGVAMWLSSSALRAGRSSIMGMWALIEAIITLIVFLWLLLLAPSLLLIPQVAAAFLAFGSCLAVYDLRDRGASGWRQFTVGLLYLCASATLPLGLLLGLFFVQAGK